MLGFCSILFPHIWENVSSWSKKPRYQIEQYQNYAIWKTSTHSCTQHWKFKGLSFRKLVSYTFLSTYFLPIILFSFSYGFPCLHSKRLCLYDSSFQYPNNVFALLFCVCARYYRFVHLSWGQWVLSVLPFSLIYDYCIHRFLHLRLYFNNNFFLSRLTLTQAIIQLTHILFSFFFIWKAYSSFPERISPTIYWFCQCV